MWSPTWPPTWPARAEVILRRRPTDAPAGTIAVGAGLAAASGVGPKASLLDRAHRAGLPVPPGLIVLDAPPAAAGPDRSHVDASPPSLVGRWLLDRGIDSTAVRSAFSCEDGDTSSRAGWYRTELGVAPADVADAMARVRDSGGADVRTDVLVMAMVQPEHAGVAFSEPGTYDDVVNVTTGLADRLVAGDTSGTRLLLPRLERADAGWQCRLRALLRRVRRHFGDRPWDVEWADDGTRCWLVQLRPITAPTVRDELLTLANHAEILPELPSTLMTSAIERAGPDLFAWYRRRVPGLPADRDFLHVVAGRPMINLSLLEDMMRHLGLPTSLVAESIGGGGGADRPAAPWRLAVRSPSLVRLGLAQIRAVVTSRRNERRVATIGEHGAASYGEALQQLHDAYVTLVTGMFPLSSAIGPPLSVLRRTGTLLDHASEHRTITAELAERLAVVRGTPPAARSPLLVRFLADFGHRGVYESDVARPRFADDVDAVVGHAPFPVDGETVGSPRPGPDPRRGLRWWLTRPIWLAAARPLAARERYRHEAMRAFAAVRSSFVELAARSTVAGQLPDPDDLWLLDVDEVRSLDDGAVFGESEVAAASARRCRLAELRPPHVVHRFDDPSSWVPAPTGASSWSGLPLTVGEVEGRAWVLAEPSQQLPDGFDPGTTVLVARSIDAGWVGTLPLVAGVAVEIGGDLSHGSILLRELGPPAITNATGIVAGVRTGDRVALHAGAGRLTLLPG